MEESEACAKESELGDNGGCFLFYFKYRKKTFCYDATNSEGFARYFNHSRIRNNIYPKLVKESSIPKIYFFAIRNITEGEELLFDYGDRSPSAVLKCPWLNN